MRQLGQSHLQSNGSPGRSSTSSPAAADAAAVAASAASATKANAQKHPCISRGLGKEIPIKLTRSFSYWEIM